MPDTLSTKVLVVGAGPAGTICAILLQQQGVDCLLVDHATFPRDKVCAGGMTPRAWQLLEQLVPGFTYDFNGVKHITLSLEGIRTCEFDAVQELRIVERKRFDHGLLQHYLSLGGRFMKAALASIEENGVGEDIVAVLKSGQRIRCNYIVGADGSNSRVRQHLTGRTEHGILSVEQYAQRAATNAIDINLSRHYDFGGYFFRFPNPVHDVLGFVDYSTTPEKGRRVMEEQGYAISKMRGQYIYQSLDYPLHDRILLVGDAGGFAHRITYEGIYSAFVTGRNAAQAIVTGKPFREVNRSMMRRTRRDLWVARVFYSQAFFHVLRLMSHCPRLMKACFDREICHKL
jgi:flavin-dependent dehydrogenase